MWVHACTIYKHIYTCCCITSYSNHRRWWNGITTPLHFFTLCLHIYFQYNFFIFLLFYLFVLILNRSCPYSYNLMSTATYMCQFESRSGGVQTYVIKFVSNLKVSFNTIKQTNNVSTLYIYTFVYIYIWKLNQTVLELDFRAVKFVFFPRRDLNPHHWYTAAPFA